MRVGVLKLQSQIRARVTAHTARKAGGLGGGAAGLVNLGIVRVAQEFLGTCEK